MTSHHQYINEKTKLGIFGKSSSISKICAKFSVILQTYFMKICNLDQIQQMSKSSIVKTRKIDKKIWV